MSHLFILLGCDLGLDQMIPKCPQTNLELLVPGLGTGQGYILEAKSSCMPFEPKTINRSLLFFFLLLENFPLNENANIQKLALIEKWMRQNCKSS